MKILGAIQARLDSARLPRKVLLPLLGKSMLAHIVERVMRSRTLAEVVVLCPMQDFAEIAGVVPCKVFATVDVEEDDLVGRYWWAAYTFGMQAAVRICADNPCIDPINIDALVQEYLLRPPARGILLTNQGDCKGASWPQGLGAEIYSAELLTWLHKTATMRAPRYREHPHLYFHHYEKYLEPPCPYFWKPPPGEDHLRFDVNTKDDFMHIEKIYNYFGSNAFSTQDLLEHSHVN